jgi:hypothetical protein
MLRAASSSARFSTLRNCIRVQATFIGTARTVRSKACALLRSHEAEVSTSPPDVLPGPDKMSALCQNRRHEVLETMRPSSQNGRRFGLLGISPFRGFSKMRTKRRHICCSESLVSRAFGCRDGISMQHSMNGDRTAVRWVIGSLPLAALAAVLYFFFEWLFFVTKRSSTSSLPILRQVEVLLKSPLELMPFLLCVQGSASLLSCVRYPRVRWIALLPAACVMGVLMMILIDNFFYTIFAIGIVTASAATRALYVAVLVELIMVAGWQLSKWFSAVFIRRRVAEGALVLSALFACAAVPSAITILPISNLDAPPASPARQGLSGPPADEADLWRVGYLGP